MLYCASRPRYDPDDHHLMPSVGTQPRGDVTVLLRRFNKGDSEAGDQFIEIVSVELRRLAAAYLRRERRGLSIQPTELVNEAVLRLMGLDRIDWQHRSHFFRVASRKMREILVDHARKRLARKRGGDVTVVTYVDDRVVAKVPAGEMVQLNDAMDALEKEYPRVAEVVEYRCFGGYTVDETAVALGIGARTVKRDWSFGCAWLQRELGAGNSAP